MKFITPAQTILVSFGLGAVAIALPTGHSSYNDNRIQVSQRATPGDETIANRNYHDGITYRDFDDLDYRDFYDDIFETRDYSYDLEDRNYYDTNLDERGMLSMAGDAVGGILNTVGAIKGGVAQDKDDRGTFTQKLLADTSKQHPRFNVVVCHTAHDKKFDGNEGVDWGHSHQEFTAQRVGGSTGYEVYWFKSGWFHRKGDGGYLNWAWSGNAVKNEKGGSMLTFKPM